MFCFKSLFFFSWAKFTGILHLSAAGKKNPQTTKITKTLFLVTGGTADNFLSPGWLQGCFAPEGSALSRGGWVGGSAGWPAPAARQEVARGEWDQLLQLWDSHCGGGGRERDLLQPPPYVGCGIRSGCWWCSWDAEIRLVILLSVGRLEDGF